MYIRKSNPRNRKKDVRRRLSDQGFLIYSVKPRRSIAELKVENVQRSGRKLNLEQFLIFNQQFVTLTKAGLPILKSLELLVGNVKNRRLRAHLESIHTNVRTGMPLSEAFQKEGVFPPIYTTSLMAGEKSGSLPEVIERYVMYQKVALGVRKKIIVSLIYPAVLVTLVLTLVLFLVTYVVPEFASLYESMDAQLPYMTQLLVAISLTISENLGLILLALLAIGAAATYWGRSETLTRLAGSLQAQDSALWADLDQVSGFTALPPDGNALTRRHPAAAGS